MRNLPRISVFQWTGMMLVLFFGTIALLEFPVGAQTQSKEAEKQHPATDADDAEAPADSPSAEESQPSSENNPPPMAPEDVPSTAELLKSAREKLLSRNYRAKIHQKLSFSNRTLHAEGSILRGQKFRMRLEFEIQSAGTTGKLLQVCNGERLWTQRQVNNVTKLTVQDIKEILNQAQPNSVPENLVTAEMGLGGVASLLASMDRTMKFEEPELVTVDEETLLLVNGQWNAAFRAKIEANPQLGKTLPEYIPEGARIYFDRNHFPRRIQYLKKEGKSDVRRPVVTLDFRDVEWLTDEEIQPEMFEYEPPDQVFPEDVTKAYIDRLKPPSPPAVPPKP